MRLLLLIGPPDASLANAAALIGAQSTVAPFPPGRLLTALAHTGIEANVDKAPYDHILAGPAQRMFLERVEGGLEAWPEACRAYLDTLVASAAITGNAPLLLDTAPEYAWLWPFIERVLPDANPIVLVRNPVATAAEVLPKADAPKEAQLLRAWKHLAALLRTRGHELSCLRHENLLDSPETEWRTLEGVLGGSRQLATQDMAALEAAAATEREWPKALANDPARLARVRALMEKIPPDDLDSLGYPWQTAWEPVEQVLGRPIPARQTRVRWHAAVRAVAGRAAAFVAARPGAAANVRRLKLACDVLLRE